MSEIHTKLPDDHPENSPAAEAMRDVECVCSVEWCYERTYMIRFAATATAKQIEAFLDEVEAECGLTPTDDQPRRGVLVQREFMDIEIEGAT